MKVLILGGGASGLMAALSAAQDEQNTVTVLERQSRVGRKLLATGNGRCNLTNLDLSPVHYHGQDAGFARAALSRFDGTATLDFFHALGLLTTAEPSGRVYPLSDQSNSVVDVLRFAAAQAGVQLVCGFDAQSVKKKARGYQVTGADSSAYFGDKLIIACGGCAGKALGGTMSGYELLSQLGHSRTALHPSLTQIRTDPAPIRGLKGVRADCRIRLRADGRTLLEDAGEVQFTETGVSGPAAFTLSRAAGQAQGAELLLDFFAGVSRAAGAGAFAGTARSVPGAGGRGAAFRYAPSAPRQDALPCLRPRRAAACVRFRRAAGSAGICYQIFFSSRHGRFRLRERTGDGGRRPDGRIPRRHA